MSIFIGFRTNKTLERNFKNWPLGNNNKVILEPLNYLENVRSQTKRAITISGSLMNTYQTFNRYQTATPDPRTPSPPSAIPCTLQKHLRMNLIRQDCDKIHKQFSKHRHRFSISRHRLPSRILTPSTCPRPSKSRIKRLPQPAAALLSHPPLSANNKFLIQK